jgi:hypothetical protein
MRAALREGRQVYLRHGQAPVAVAAVGRRAGRQTSKARVVVPMAQTAEVTAASAQLASVWLPGDPPLPPCQREPVRDRPAPLAGGG